MNDIEGTVRAGLHDMAEDVHWSAVDPDAVVSRHRRARRARAGVVAVIAAVATVVAVPTAVGPLGAAPAGQVATPGEQDADPTPVLPAEPVEPLPGFTEAETVQALAEFAAGRRWERADSIALGECLTAAGWEVTVHYDGVSWRGTEEASDAFEASTDTCRAAQAPRPPLSELALRVVHADYLSAHACLVAQGFQPADPVDEPTFIASGGGGWYPLEGIPDDRAVVAGRQCPIPER